MRDLIDRQAAIYMKFSHGITEDGILYVPYREVKMNLEELPSAQPRTKCIAEIKISKEDLDKLVAEKVEEIKAAQPERKRGKWFHDVAFYDEEGCPCVVSRCNQCGEENPETNYCPHCGADMRDSE